MKATFSKTTKDYHFITLANLPDAQEKGMLIMKLPNIEKELTFEATKVEAKSKAEYSWFGNLKEGVGNAVLIANKDGFTGTIEAEGKHYMIHTLSEGQIVLVEHDRKKNKEKTVCLSGENQSGSKEKKGKRTSSECQDWDIRILFVHTPAGGQVQPMNDIANSSMVQLQQTLANSQCIASVTMAGIVEIGSLSETGDMDTDLGALQNNGDIQTAVTQTQADLIVMLSNTNYPGLLGRANNFLGRYAVVVAQTTVGTRTFPHEVAHLLNSRHQQSAIYDGGLCWTFGLGDNSPGSNHGYGIYANHWIPFDNTKRYYKTTEHTNVDFDCVFDGDNRIVQMENLPFFSNPNVNYPIFSNYWWGGSIDVLPLGTSNNNNAQAINDARSIAANHFTSAGQNGPQGFFFIQQLSQSQNCSTNFIADACGVGSLSYSWDFSFDGFSYMNFGSGSFINANMPNAPVHIRLTVTDGLGRQSFYYQFTTEPMNCYRGGGSQRIAAKLVETNQESENHSLHFTNVFPNPAVEDAKVEYFVPNDKQSISLKVYDSQGRLLMNVLNEVQNKGTYEALITTKQLQSGKYILNLSNGKESKSQSLIVAQ